MDHQDVPEHQEGRDHPDRVDQLEKPVQQVEMDNRAHTDQLDVKEH